MKKHLLFACGILVFAVASCKKDQPVFKTTATDNYAFENSAMSLEIDGSHFTIAEDSISVYNSDSLIRMDCFLPTGYIELRLFSTSTVGTHPISENYQLDAFVGAANHSSSTNGTITISSHDTSHRVIKGTFSGTFFAGTDSVVITNGAFTVDY